MNLEYTDLELWESMGKDNAAAFEEIYNRYSKNMYVYALNIFKKREVCEDIVQDIFIDFWSKRGKVEVSNIKAYLFQSVKFQVFKQLRNQKIAIEDLTRLNIIDVSMNVSQKLELDELEAVIKDRVDKLSPKCKQVFIMSRYNYKSNQEIALELGVSEQAVKNQISKAIKLIREELYSEELILLFFVLNM